VNTARRELLEYLNSTLEKRQRDLEEWERTQSAVVARTEADKEWIRLCKDWIVPIQHELDAYKRWIAWLEKQAD